VEKFNRYAATGKDEAFNRGGSAIDTFYGDPSCKPNPSIGPLDKPPYYAVEIWPGDIGTNGGLKTDARARVLREDGSPIEGLYAVGNCAASVMGRSYAGAGATIGPSMVFGYIAARHAAGAGK
jgi:3-oxosteroid 1-dehydrogenase